MDSTTKSYYEGILHFCNNFSESVIWLQRTYLHEMYKQEVVS